MDGAAKPDAFSSIDPWSNPVLELFVLTGART